MKKDLLKEIIRDFHVGSLPETKKRALLVPTDTGKIITLSGVRRGGKTFLLFETIKSLLRKGIPVEKILYVNFEDERLELKRQDIDLILQAYRELYPDIKLSECYLFFDEVQNVEGWQRFIRRVYDTVTKNIFVTGSNSRLLSKEIATSLRGRTLTLEVFPLTFKEYLQFNQISIDLYHTGTRAKIISFFERFLREGGFPEILTLNDGLKKLAIQEYFEVMLYRDMVERFSFSNIPVLKYFMKRIFDGITTPISVNKIYNELRSQGYRVGKNSLYEFLQAAESVYLLLIAKKYSESILKQEMAEKKVYAIDNGLLNAVTFRFSKDLGRLLENLLFLELYKKGHRPFFYKNKRECDFIVFDPSGRARILQVCYSISDRSTREREIAGLKEACQRLGLKDGYIITGSEQEEIKAADLKIHVIPAYKFILEDL